MSTVKCLVLFFLCSSVFSKEALRIYAYDSLLGKGSLGEILQKRFKERYGADVEYVSFASAGEALNQLALEGKQGAADILVGIDQNQIVHAKELALFDESVSHSDPKFNFFVPFDYGFLAFVYDSERIKTFPKSLTSFSEDPKLAKKIVLEDPRTSSLGQSFLLWTRTDFKEEKAFSNFWKKFRRQILTLTPGWSGAYGLFLQGSADFVLSYTTSPAYHIEKEKKNSIKFVPFPEGHFKQVEGACLLKNSLHKELAKKWLELLLSEEIQSKIPTTQWMFPVSKTVKLPESFSGARPPRETEADLSAWEKDRKKVLSEWTRLLVEK